MATESTEGHGKIKYKTFQKAEIPYGRCVLSFDVIPAKAGQIRQERIWTAEGRPEGQDTGMYPAIQSIRGPLGPESIYQDTNWV